VASISDRLGELARVDLLFSLLDPKRYLGQITSCVLCDYSDAMQFKPGDWVLSAPECDPEALPEPRQVEEVFTNFLPLLHVQVGGKTIRTTSEHPFYVRGKGWTAAKDLQAGDLLRSHDGQWVAVESVSEGEELAAVYNLRVAEHHTYFVGSRDWGFSVWAHNACLGIFSQQGLSSFVARQAYTLENLVITGSWSVSRAAARLGIGLSDLQIRGGIAFVGRIGNATALASKDIATLMGYLASRGANQAVVLSGVVLNKRLLNVLEYLAQTGKSWPGVLPAGSRITVFNDILRTFRIFVPF